MSVIKYAYLTGQQNWIIPLNKLLERLTSYSCCWCFCVFIISCIGSTWWGALKLWK